MKKKIKSIKVRKDGWTRWHMPVMKGYIMGCCDCGLRHEVEFLPLRLKRKLKNGYNEYKKLDPKKYRIALKMRRA